MLQQSFVILQCNWFTHDKINTRCCFKTIRVNGRVLTQGEVLDKRNNSLKVPITRTDKIPLVCIHLYMATKSEINEITIIASGSTDSATPSNFLAKSGYHYLQDKSLSRSSE